MNLYRVSAGAPRGVRAGAFVIGLGVILWAGAGPPARAGDAGLEAERGREETRLRLDQQQARERKGDVSDAERERLDQRFERERLDQRRLHDSQRRRSNILRLQEPPPAGSRGAATQVQRNRFRTERSSQQVHDKIRRGAAPPVRRGGVPARR